MDNDFMDGYRSYFAAGSEHAPGGVIVYNAQTDRIVHVNKYLVDLCECESVEDFMSLVKGSFSNFVHEDDAIAVQDSIQSQIENRGGYGHIYYRVKTKSGTLVSVEEYGRLDQLEDGTPVFNAFVTKASQGDFVDWLTGLPSMARFHHLAKSGVEAIKSRGQRPVAIALDLVNMKSFNSQYGREEGDKLLRAFADVLRKSFGTEACSRYSEDHFYAFASEDGIQEKIEDLFAEFRESNGGRVLPVRVGVYPCEPDDDIVAVGFDHAKAACDLDRVTWDSHITWFNDELKAQAKLRLHILNHVEQSISEGWIRPYYQPILRFATGNICREEALARWIDPVFGPLSPAQFIPVLEEAGLLHKLDMSIVDCVLDDIATKREHDVPVVPVSVNISLRDLRKVNIADEISRKADAKGVEHDLLRIEFTESAASEEPELFKAQVDALHDAGFMVWMDDFGSGYSSLNTLQDFDFDLIKLDMGFISKCEDRKARSIIAGVVKIARELGISTLAEGVETEAQALYLESIGCDMLQGYFFLPPQPLEIVMGRYKRVGTKREDPRESGYWRKVGNYDLSNPMANMEGRRLDGSLLAEFPAGVMEHRDGKWYFTRANQSYREFLDHANLLDLSRSNLTSNETEGALEEEFLTAVDRTKESGAWERVGGRLEYGTGFQFYVKHQASAPHADSFAIASVPTMLGTALGSYGDVPVAYAVFRVKLNEAENEVVDTEYVYANETYHRWLGYEPESLTGRSFLEAVDDASTVWFPYCYRAAILGEAVHDVVFSTELGHWLSFSIAPSPVKGCCVYAFMMVDEEQLERERLEVGRDTSDFVIRIANVLNNVDDYDVAMNQALEMMSEVIHPERLYVFERGETTSDNTFEWCAEGVEPMIDSLQGLDNSEFDTWEKLMAEEPVVLIPDVEEFKDTDPQMYWQLERQGITHLLAVPFLEDGKLIGYLGADNYALDERLDTKRLLESVALFMSSRIAGNRTLRELERAGTHDSLTGLLNRRGVDLEIARRLSERSGEPFTLALMDIDNLKSLNEVHGHGVGDEALREIARVASDLFPEGSVLGRNGADEFLVMLFGDDAENAESLLDRFSQSKLECEYDGERYKLLMSIGYTDYPEQTDTLTKAYSLADAALNAVKLAGKSGAKRYSSDLDDQNRS